LGLTHKSHTSFARTSQLLVIDKLKNNCSW